MEETKLLKQYDVNNHEEYSLKRICDWSRPENTAIEYHDSNTITTIKYSDLQNAKTQIKDLLYAARSEGLIAINSDVKTFCVPALILGIQDQNCGFINLPEINKLEICLTLKIKFIFSANVVPETSFISEFDVHGETIKLLKFNNEIISENRMDKRNFAYAITTSGSTGKPKIVRVPHACIVPNIVDIKNILQLSESDKIAQITPLTFDPSIIEIFSSLTSGGTLFVVSNDGRNNPHELLRLIFKHKVTVLQTTPSLWRLRWSDNQIKNTILSKESCLRTILIGGEPFPKLETFRTIKDAENCTKIYNIYGITEVSCWASIKEIDFTNLRYSDTTIHQNLGKPLSQTVFQVRDIDGNVIRDGEGELYVGSDSRICVIDGEEPRSTELPVYRKTGDLVTIKGDNIFYKNRSGRIVKRLGNKIDLSKIESTVLELNFVQSCAALWDEKSHKLYLCVSLNNAEQINNKFNNSLRAGDELKKQLKSLPAFYQPDEVKYLNKFQLTTSGKICHRTLMTLFQNSRKPINETSEVEVARKTLKQIWENSLTLNNDPDAGFLDNGGNSVTAIQISNLLCSTIDKEFPELIGLLLRNQTLSKCLEYVAEKITCSLEESRINHRTSILEPTPVRVHKKMKYDSTHLEKVSKPDTCVWQKCRGKMIGVIAATDSPRVSVIPKLSIAYTKDLKKCIDASPTIFKYASGDIYASVGSHAGIILTKQLNSSDSITHVVNLPDRIEASVLALDEFKGIIGCYDGNVYCLNLKSGKIVWKFKTGDTVKCTAILSDDKKSVYVGSYDKYFYSISVKDGSEIWKLKAGEGSISATPCTSFKWHSVMFGTLDGTCVSLNQTSGQIIWKNKFRDPVFSAPAVLENGNIIFCSVSGEVNCFDLETGLKIWEYKIDGNVFSHLVVTKHLNDSVEDLIIGSNNKNIYCLALGNIESAPSLRYSVSFEYPIFSTPYHENGILIVADTGGNISLLNSLAGKIIQCLKLNGQIFSSPVINEDLIVVGCRDNNFYVIKIHE